MDVSNCSFDSLCCVCLEELPIIRQASGLDCIHREMFHIDCIDEWLISRRTCPLCRTEVILQFDIEEPPAPVIIPMVSSTGISATVPGISKTLFILCITTFTFLLGIYNMFYLFSVSQKGLNFILFVIQFMYGAGMLVFLCSNILEIFVSSVIVVAEWNSTTVFINTGFVFSLIVFFSVVK